MLIASLICSSSPSSPTRLRSTRSPRRSLEDYPEPSQELSSSRVYLALDDMRAVLMTGLDGCLPIRPLDPHPQPQHRQRPLDLSRSEAAPPTLAGWTAAPQPYFGSQRLIRLPPKPCKASGRLGGVKKPMPGAGVRGAFISSPLKGVVFRRSFKTGFK